ncbi:hypothetical protein B1748_09400 [Paenibacillus sp. MY03]|uniref:stage II sporulation protein P n=1 Tax=Paenibacillus sp. MY03 TaxID=302980 RepID=UPI000B3C6095|nr:stage II sporulation protein P [Paenibacillus sp. MY03]OUS76795.1 hypothetical protein B1748_09400 [Paenibacillus sp. MY03]
MMYKLRERLVSGTFFASTCLLSMVLSVGWGLAADSHPTTYAAVHTETEGAVGISTFLQPAPEPKVSFLGGIQMFPGWDDASLTAPDQDGAALATAAAPPASAAPALPSASKTPDKPNPASAPIDKTDKPAAPDAKSATVPVTPAKDKPVSIASASPRVLVYHTHNRESYFPELQEGTKNASSKTVNVTLVGKRLTASLQKLGIPALQEKMDYPTTISKFNYAYSYKYSKQTVVDALSENKELTYLLDIHRDSLKRNKTTVEIHGKNYAKILFVIGEKNPNWKDNKAFATKLHEALNAKFPGISRGVLTKAPGTGNAEYNQSLSKNSLVVEMGGVDNTLEESYRTADALAAILHELDQNGKV